MSFKRLRLHIKNEEGSGLVLALMTLLVLSVLGASLGAVTVGSFKLGDVNRDDTSVYYIAEAGANMAYEEMKAGVLEAYSKYDDAKGLFYQEIEDNNNGLIKSIEENTYEFEDQFGDTPTVSINFSDPEGSNPRKYTIISTGVVAGKTRTVEKQIEVSWFKKKSSQAIYIPDNASILSRSGTEVKNNGVSIIGDVHIDALGPPGFKATKEFDFNDTVYFHPELNGNYNKVTQGGIAKKTENLKTRDKPLPWSDYVTTVENVDFPDYSTYPYLSDAVINQDSSQHKVIDNGDILITDYRADNYLLNLEGDYRVNTLSINSNRTLNINTNNSIVNLVVNSLNIPQGNINIIDNGHLNLFVMNSFTFNGSSKINNSGRKEQFNLYYAGEDNITLSGNQYINGGVYIKKSGITLTGSGNVSGMIVSNGDEIEIRGGSINDVFLFAPKATISLKEGGKVRGVVVANQIYLDGGTKIEFSEISADQLIFESSTPSSGGTGNVDISQLIKTAPALEVN